MGGIEVAVEQNQLTAIVAKRNLGASATEIRATEAPEAIEATDPIEIEPIETIKAIEAPEKKGAPDVRNEERVRTARMCRQLMTLLSLKTNPVRLHLLQVKLLAADVLLGVQK